MKKYLPLSILRISALIILCLSSFICSGQSYSQKGDFWGRVRYGGGIGLGFGNDSFTLQLAPSAIYQANDYLGLGVGLSYNYAKFGEDRFSAFGGSLLSLFNPIPALQLSAEFEEMRVHRDYQFALPQYEEDYWLPALYVGLGYSSGPVTFGIRYDLLHDDAKSLYADPWMPFVRVYF
jgi:hypothetical protein